MSASENLKQAFANSLAQQSAFTKRDFSFSPGSNGSRTKVAEFKAERPYALQNGVPVDLALMAYEEFSASGASPEQFSLSHDLIQSGATSDDIVVYVNGSEATIQSTDYSNDTVSVNTSNGDTVGVFYASGKQAQVEVQKTAPNSTSETLWTGDVSLIHLRDHDKDPIRFSLDQSYWQSVIPTDWKLELYVDAPYVTRFEKDIGGTSDPEEATNALITIPYYGGTNEVGGLSETVRLDAARR